MLKRALTVIIICFCCLAMAIPVAMADEDHSDYQLRIDRELIGDAVLVEAYCKNVSSGSHMDVSRFSVTREAENGDPSTVQMEKNIELEPGEEARVGVAGISPPITQIKLQVYDTEEKEEVVVGKIKRFGNKR